MKNLIRNTLVRDFIGVAFCLMMSLALLMMYSGCSEDNSPINGAHGGAAEEQGVYALVGQAGDVYPRLLKSAEEEGKDSLKNEGSVFASKGTIVSVYELDSLTLDTTGRFFVDAVNNDSGYFKFDSLDLNSPYVLIVMQESCYTEDCRDRGLRYAYNDEFVKNENSHKYKRTLSAMVCLRDIEKVRVNSLTMAKIPLLRAYMAEGKTFAEANELAEREILENLGIYDNLGTFEDLSRDDSELFYVNELFRLDSADIRFQMGRLNIPLYFAPVEAFSVLGKSLEEYYLNSVKMIEYEIGYLARQDGLGRCSESRENETGAVKDALGNDIAVVCRSGKWTIGFKKIDHSKGSVTDKRDGKIYKTVTYNFGGNSQTWMAENLDFADAASCYHPEVHGEGCGAYGREYQWHDAMKIEDDSIKSYSVGAQGDTILLSKRCVDAYLNDSMFLASVKAVVDSCDTVLYGSENQEKGRIARSWAWNYMDYVTPTNQNSYQGICPDGWRIPSLDDWMTLLRNLGEQYGVDYSSVVPVLYDGEATGFGLKSYIYALGGGDGAEYFRVLIRRMGFYNYFVMADVLFYVMDFFNTWKVHEGFDLNFPSEMHMTIYKNENKEQVSELLQGALSDPYQKAAVRCIKN